MIPFQILFKNPDDDEPFCQPNYPFFEVLSTFSLFHDGGS